MKLVKWVILDAMGVVYRVGDDVNDLLVPYVQQRRPEITRQRINELYMDASLGRITPKQFWDGIELGDEYPLIQRRYLDDWLETNEGLQPTLDILRQGYHLAILSNDVDQWSKYLRAKHGLDDYFDHFVISGCCGIRKPDRGIYEVLSQTIGSQPERCVFVDDRDKNLVPAMKMGFKTILFSAEPQQENVSGSLRASQLAALPAMVDALFADT